MTAKTSPKVERLAQNMYLSFMTRGCGNDRALSVALWNRDASLRRTWIRKAKRAA